MANHKSFDEKSTISGYVEQRLVDEIDNLITLGYFSNRSEAVSLGVKTILESYDPIKFLEDEIKDLQNKLKILKEKGILKK